MNEFQISRAIGRVWRARRLAAILGFIVSVAPVVVPADIVGVVTVSEGESRVIRDTGYFAVERGIDVDEGDVIRTAEDAHVQLEMNDGSIFEIGESSEFYLNEYQLRNDDSVENAAVSLVKGWLRFITAKVRTSRRYEINMSVATIGIRGTEGVLASDPAGSTVLLETGQVEVFELDDAGELGASELIEAGEFIQRERGKRIAKLRSAPAEFREVMPGHFKKRAKRLKADLKRRGIKPKKLRAVRYEDVQGLLKANPRVRRKSAERFKSRLDDPEFKDGLKRHMKDHPDWQSLIDDSERGKKGNAAARKGATDHEKGARKQSGQKQKNGKPKKKKAN